MIAEAKAYAQSKIILANAKALIMTETAKTRLTSASMSKDGFNKEAEAEVQFAQNLDGKRKHEERMVSVDNWVNIMKENKIIIGGKTGDELFSYFKET